MTSEIVVMTPLPGIFEVALFRLLCLAPDPSFMSAN